MKNLLINCALAAKKKKIFTFFLSVAASVGTIFAGKVQIGDLYYNLDATNQTAEVTYKSYNDNNYNYNEGWNVTTANIPSSVTYNSVTYSVTSIGEYAFYNCSSLTSVTIPNGVTSIGEWAFFFCSSLTSITIPNSVTSIGDWVFAGCSSLTSITIPNGVTSIGEYAFYNCSSLTSVTIPNSVTSIGSGAFSSCSSLTSVTIPNSVTSIGDNAFLDCSSLTSINVDSNNPNYSSVDGVLFNKDKTTLVAFPGGKQGAYTIPNSVTSIGEGAFLGCSSLTSVTIGNSVTSIGYATFAGCSSLTSVTIGNSVTSIGESAFYNCSSLTSVTIGNSVTSIGKSAFYRCSSLTSITIPNSVTSIGSSAFWGCDKLVDVYCYATTPPATDGADIFSNYNVFLYIPCESKKAYMMHALWGNFKYIECISSEDIENVQSDEVQSTKVIKDGQVLILRNGKTYTMQGQEVK